MLSNTSKQYMVKENILNSSVNGFFPSHCGLFTILCKTALNTFVL